MLKEEKTKVGVAYIKNPDNVYRPTRIIALGASEEEYGHGRCSRESICPTLQQQILVDDSGLFAAALSRLANTDR